MQKRTEKVAFKDESKRVKKIYRKPAIIRMPASGKVDVESRCRQSG